jgi:UPF0755 protein
MKPFLQKRPRATNAAGSGRFWFARDVLVVVISAVIVFAAFTQMTWFLSTRELDEAVIVKIPAGASVREIASILEEKGLVRDPGKFVMAARVLRLTERLQAGLYEFGPVFSEFEILTVLKSGVVAGRHLLIPEGYRAAQIAGVLEDKLGIDPDEFMELVRDPETAGALGVEASSLEGYLHPDTYRMRIETTARDAIEIMVRETWRFFDARKLARADSLGMSVHEVLTLASIVEAEAMFDRERKRISAVFHNRMRNGWRLEADPTVRYALGNYRRRLYFKDLHVDSPYNTYRYAGLPPGPVCSPGRASIQAALYPMVGSGEFFFVANGDGTHTFSKTFAEHVKAKERTRAPRGAGGEGFSLDTEGDG